MKVYYFINRLQYFGFNEKLNQSFCDHSVSEKENQVFIRPKEYNKNSISVENFFSIREKYDIELVILYDRVVGVNKKVIVSDHINRSGFYPLCGNTPYKKLTMFPDMSKIYVGDPSQKNVTVHTLGPKRFRKKQSNNSVIYSEGAAAVSVLWHYLDVKVKCFGIPF